MDAKMRKTLNSLNEEETKEAKALSKLENNIDRLIKKVRAYVQLTNTVKEDKDKVKTLG
jgi:uncharacterized coiled-coil DUF342 family protein